MVKHTQTTRRQKPTNCLSVFDHFVGLALKGYLLRLSSFNSFLTDLRLLTETVQTLIILLAMKFF